MTFVKWHSAAFKTFWRWKSRKRGRPALPKNLRELVRRIAHDNPNLFLTFQGNVSGQSVYVATHSLRGYSDGPIEFDINRDNAETTGYALICISGYLADA